MSFFLLSVTIIIVFAVVAQTMKGTTLSESRVRASYVAHDLLNQERALDFAKITPVTGTITQVGTRDGKPAIHQFLYSVDVETLDADTRRIRASVRWTESTGPTAVTLQTVVTNL